jgi:hypothetical protein
MVVTTGTAACSLAAPTKPASCADITHARRLGLVRLLADGPAVEILADAGCQGAQTGGRALGRCRLPIANPSKPAARAAEPGQSATGHANEEHTVAATGSL